MGITQQIGASSLIKPGVIDNTAARPASPYEGQVIFQKDTDQLLVWNGTAWVIPNSPAQNPMGLELITPTSVSGAGVTLVNSTVTISAASTASIIGCFDSNYTNYMVVYNFTASSSYVRMKLRNTSGDISTGYGATVAYINDNSTAWSWLNPAATSWNDTRWLITMPTSSFGSVSIFNPNLAIPTWIDGSGTSAASTNSAKYVNGGRNAGSDVGTGLTFFPDSGTFTGTICVYGYRK